MTKLYYVPNITKQKNIIKKTRLNYDKGLEDSTGPNLTLLSLLGSKILVTLRSATSH